MGIHNPAHPGEILKGLALDPLGLSVTDAARCRTAYRFQVRAAPARRETNSPEAFCPLAR
jgi:plasmid maintenance system antidote protein VapI